MRFINKKTKKLFNCSRLSFAPFLKKCLPHFCLLQDTVFLAGPSLLQSFPPSDGGGLVQVLVSVFFPPPHVTLHSEADQSV